MPGWPFSRQRRGRCSAPGWDAFSVGQVVQIAAGNALDILPDVPLRRKRRDVHDPTFVTGVEYIDVRTAAALEQNVDRGPLRKLIQETRLDDMDILPAVTKVIKGIQARDPVKSIVLVHIDIRAGRLFYDQSVRHDERCAARDRPGERRALRIERDIDEHKGNQYACS